MAMRKKGAMANITKGAYLAIGNVTDPGVIPDSPGGNVSICFRQDTNNNAQSDFADNWKCYYRDTNEDLWFCEDVPTSNVPVSSQTDCDSGTLGQRLLTLTDPNFFGIVEDANRLDYVEITLSTRYDPAVFPDPITNPEYTATTRISPPGHSRW